MRRKPVEILSSTLFAVLIFVCAYYTFRFATLAAARIPTASALEMNESICLDLATQVAHDRPLYAKPSADLSSAPYPPLYFLIGGFLLKFSGIAFWPLRLLSTLSTLLICGITFAMLGREYSIGARLISAFLFLAAFEKSGYWYDIARVDMLETLLLVSSAWAMLRSTHRFGAVFSIILMCASLFTKQTAIFFLPALVYVAYRRFELLYAIASACIPALSFGLYAYCDKWRWFYMFELPRAQAMVPAQIVLFTDGCIPLLAATCLMAGLAWSKVKPSSFMERCVWYFYICAIICGITGSLKVGGAINTCIPFFYFNAIAAGICWDRACGRRGSLQHLIRCLALLQFGLCYYTGSFALRERDIASLDVPLIGWLQKRSSPKPVYFHKMRGNHLAAVSSHATAINYQSLVDLHLSHSDYYTNVTNELAEDIRAGRMSYIVISSAQVNDLEPDLPGHYRLMTQINSTSFGDLLIFGPDRVMGLLETKSIQEGQ